MEAACSPIPPGKCSGRDFPATRPEPPESGFTQAAALAGWDEAALQSLAELSISPMNPNQQQQHLQMQQQTQNQRSAQQAPAHFENEWYYQDPQGRVQGPFSSEDMRDWFDNNYFKKNLF